MLYEKYLEIQNLGYLTLSCFLHYISNLFCWTTCSFFLEARYLYAVLLVRVNYNSLVVVQEVKSAACN